MCLDHFSEWSDELLETFEWGEEGVVYEEVLPKLAANLACTISTWQRPIDYIRQPLPPEPVEGEGWNATTSEPVTMAGPGNWNEIEKDGEGRNYQRSSFHRSRSQMTPKPMPPLWRARMVEPRPVNQTKRRISLQMAF